MYQTRRKALRRKAGQHVLELDWEDIGFESVTLQHQA